MPAPDPITEAGLALGRYVRRFPGEAARLERLREQLQDDRAILLRSNMRGHITTSMLVLDGDAKRALLVHHRTFDLWLQPGGHYEAPGSLWASACREVAEETGLAGLRPYCAAECDREPLDIDTHPIPAHAGKREDAHWHHDFAYVAIATEPFVPTPQVAEVSAAQWVALEAIARYPNDRLRRVVDKAIRFIADGRFP